MKAAQKIAVLIKFNRKKIAPERKLITLIKQAVIFCAKEQGFDSEAEIGILLTDDSGIQRYNKRFRNMNKPTDVLSFPMFEPGAALEGSAPGGPGPVLLGDIIISLQSAERQAVEYGHPFEREVIFLVTHGMFHLFGYDHHDEHNEDIMAGKQEKVLGMLGLQRIQSD